MEDFDFFEGKKSIKQISFLLNKGSTKLDCTIWEEWKVIDPTPFTLRCNNKREIKVLNRTGFEKTSTETFESNIGGTLGIKGIASLESSLKSSLKEEIKFQSGKEVTDTYTFSSPQCGYLLVRLYKKARTFYVKYEDTRFWHKRSVEFPLVEWQKYIYDGTVSQPYDPSCNCGDKPATEREGTPCRVVFANFSKLAVFWQDTRQLEFPESPEHPLNSYFSTDESVWKGKVPARLLPEYLGSLAGLQPNEDLDAQVWQETVFFPRNPEVFSQQIETVELDENFQPIQNVFATATAVQVRNEDEYLGRQSQDDREMESHS